jgi:hypothetical protein
MTILGSWVGAAVAVAAVVSTVLRGARREDRLRSRCEECGADVQDRYGLAAG